MPKEWRIDLEYFNKCKDICYLIKEIGFIKGQILYGILNFSGEPREVDYCGIGHIHCSLQ